MTPGAIVRADAAFETALGLVLIVGAATGRLGPDDFPDPVGTPVIVTFGIALLAVGALLWRLATTIDLRALAAANLATAVLVLVWYLAASGFSTAGTAVTIATLVVLVLRGAVQLRRGA